LTCFLCFKLDSRKVLLLLLVLLMPPPPRPRDELICVVLVLPKL
jgi:hypothetical protein